MSTLHTEWVDTLKDLMIGNWIPLTEAIPPYGRLVLTSDGTRSSTGRITKIDTQYPATARTNIEEQITLHIEWKSMAPHIFEPTHWQPIPQPK